MGKTSAIRKVAAARSGLRPRGFYTEEIREAGERRGFRLLTLDGQERVMAHVAPRASPGRQVRRRCRPRG